MSRLPPRKYCPPHVKLRVVLRQFGWERAVVDDLVKFLERRNGGVKALLDRGLIALASKLGCERKELRRDHNPALGLRELNRRTGKYTPDENDPEFMEYRSAHGHHIKTNVRGDGAQLSDTALMKRERKRKKKKVQARRRWSTGRKIRSRNNLRRR